MSVSESEKSLRRRLLFNSLPAGTSLEIIQQAIDLLDNEFGEEPNLLYGSLVNRLKETPVSYTHLTLPTIYSV